MPICGKRCAEGVKKGDAGKMEREKGSKSGAERLRTLLRRIFRKCIKSKRRKEKTKLTERQNDVGCVLPYCLMPFSMRRLGI